jgi:ergothioneine biosynthesis protein EgtB
MMEPRVELEHAWRRTDEIFELVQPAALFDQPIALRQPVIFYVGHLPAFAWNQLARGLRGASAFDAAKDELFARGIDPVDTDAYTAARPDDWPSPAATLAYRDAVRARLRELAGTLDPSSDPDRAVLHTVLEHERMHHETLLYMFEQLPADRKRVPDDPPPPAAAVANARVAIPAGTATLGAADDAPFAWDNERARHEALVPAFAIDTLPVTNAAFRAFVDAGGYRERSLWDADGWAWRFRRGLVRPHAWIDRDGLRLRTLAGDLPWDDVADRPASVSHAEATAYARWRGARLPTEAEFHRAAYGAPDGTERAFPWGDAPPAPAHGNFGLHRSGPTPVGAFPGGASAWGVHELAGNGWEWTSTPFGPFPGFAPMPHYAGYSADFFDGKHYVMKGASWATDEVFLRRSFRNWFQPHYPYVFSKFRLAYGA